MKDSIQNNSAELRLNVILEALSVDKSRMAEELSIDRSLLVKVINGSRKNPQIRAQIADYIAMKVKGLWAASTATQTDQ